MNTNQLLNVYFNTANSQININEFAVDMLLTALLAYVLSVIYAKFGHSLSNRKTFAANFVLLALTTMLIISIVKSSLALSLGLVGALSIVRFRSAIKEPEELTYLFLSISIGLGFGAEQRYVTVLAFSFIAIILILKGLFVKVRPIKSNLYVNVSSKHKLTLNFMTKLLKEHARYSTLKRVDETGDNIEFLFSANFASTEKLSNFKDKIREHDKNAELRFFEEKAIFN